MITSIFKRIRNLAESKIDTTITICETPEYKINQSIKTRIYKLDQLKEIVIRCITNEKVMQNSIDKYTDIKINWEKRSELALKNGSEELAKEAIKEVIDTESQIDILQTEHKKQYNYIVGLKQDIFKMEKVIDKIKFEKDFILAQIRTNQIKKSIVVDHHNFDKYDSNIEDDLQKLYDMSEKSLCELEATEEIENMNSSESLTLASKFEKLEKDDIDELVENRLDILKNKVLN